MKNIKKKIAFVNQRYGLEVNGGSEYYTRMLTEHLLTTFDVEILTTCALDYTKWDNHYPEGLQEVNGVSVRRFRVEKPRDEAVFNEVNTRLLTISYGERDVEEEWVDKQGPFCPQLINYIVENSHVYDVFVFVTYLYYLTVRGLPLVKNKAVLIPTAHDEPYIRFGIYKEIFHAPKAFLFLTEEEQGLVHNLFNNQKIPWALAGVGIDIPENVQPSLFKKKYNLEKYLVYVGRIDEGKNCNEMFKFFIEYKKRNTFNLKSNLKSSLKLVLMGKAAIPIPSHPDILPLGFVSEEDKYNGIAGAEALILPSKYESLSISVLESMGLGVPVIVNGGCEVLKGHCIKSNAGLYYEDFLEFEGIVNFYMEKSHEYEVISKNAMKYIENCYQWSHVIDKFNEIVNKITNKVT